MKDEFGNELPPTVSRIYVKDDLGKEEGLTIHQPHGFGIQTSRTFKKTVHLPKCISIQNRKGNVFH